MSQENTTEISSGVAEKNASEQGESANIITVLLERMEGKHDFPAISKYILEINEKAGPSSHTSAAQLAGVIVKDFSLTTKLLKMVNSAIYCQFSGQIATVSRAVVILGFEQVRLATTSLIFFEHMQSKSQASEMKSAILTSFLSGILARDLAETLGVECTEEVFICSILHTFGKLMIMYYLPDEYQKFSELMKEKDLSEDDAARQVFNNTFDEISMDVAEQWGLPQTIISSMKKVNPNELAKTDHNLADGRILACFANELYDIAAADMPHNKKKGKLDVMLRKYQEAIPCSSKKVEQMIEAANSKAKDFSFVLGINKYQEDLLKHLNFKPQEKPKIKEAVPKTVEPPPSIDLSSFQLDSIPAGQSADPLTPEQQLLIMSGVQDITHALLEDNFQLDDMLNMIMETVFRGVGFSRVLISIKNPKSNTMNGRYGLGQYIDEVIRKFTFAIEERDDIFNKAVSEKCDVYIPDTEADGVKPSLPPWYKGIVKAPFFTLLPIAINNNTIGLLYADMKGSEEKISLEKLNYMKMLRDQIVLAVRQKSQAG